MANIEHQLQSKLMRRGMELRYRAGSQWVWSICPGSDHRSVIAIEALFL